MPSTFLPFTPASSPSSDYWPSAIFRGDYIDTCAMKSRTTYRKNANRVNSFARGHRRPASERDHEDVPRDGGNEEKENWENSMKWLCCWAIETHRIYGVLQRVYVWGAGPLVNTSHDVLSDCGNLRPHVSLHDHSDTVALLPAGDHRFATG